jgi:hypothetical protein
VPESASIDCGKSHVPHWRLSYQSIVPLAPNLISVHSIPRSIAYARMIGPLPSSSGVRSVFGNLAEKCKKDSGSWHSHV